MDAYAELYDQDTPEGNPDESGKPERDRALETEAIDAGKQYGYSHANYTNNCGGDIASPPNIPCRFLSVESRFLAGWAEGIEQYANDQDDE